MATTLFNNLILAAARRLKDSRTDPTSAGDTNKRYSSAILSEYANRAIRDLLKDNFKANPSQIPSLFPEYVRETSAITLASATTYAAVALPTDVWYLLDANKSDFSLHYLPLAQELVENVKAGIDPIIIPSATQPYWWQQNNQLCALPKGQTDAMICRYLRTHQDITPTLGASTNGDYLSTGTASYTASTQTISGATMGSGFTSNDVNKVVAMKDSSNITYIGRISSYVSASSVILYGYGLPAGNVTINQLLKMDSSPDSTDLALNLSWHGEIIDRMVAYGLQDAKAGVV